VDGCHYDYNTKLEKEKTLHPTLLKGFRFLQHLFEQYWSLDPFNMPHKCAGNEILYTKVSLINLQADDHKLCHSSSTTTTTRRIVLELVAFIEIVNFSSPGLLLKEK
jgi:hypothetical protein